MDCKHPRLKSVNCTVICCECGAVLPPDVLQRKPEGQEEKPAEAPKTARKRKTKKEGDQ